MKTKTTLFKTYAISIICIFISLSTTAQFVQGEIIADTNNVTVIKIWGTHYDRGYAHGYLLGDKIREVIEGYLMPHLGSLYPSARILVTNGDDLVLDSIYHIEAQAMIAGMVSAGCDTSNIDYIDILVGACFSDLYGYMGKSMSGSECSTFLNWGDATSGTDLDGKSVIARFYDWGSYEPYIINNAVIIIHIPSEEGLQPWLIAGYAGEMVPSGGGLNQGGISVYKNGLGDFPNGTAVMGLAYEPYQITMRKALEIDDYNNDGVHNTQDVRDALDSNPQGYPTGHAVSVLARFDPDSDSLTAMIAEIAPIAPTHVYRTNSYEDLIPGDNLYAANRQIKRNNAQNYCARYMNMVNHMGDGTGIGSQENWDLMINYSATTNYCYGFMQHIPELDIMKLSVYRNGTNAFLLEPTVFNLREFFNRPPEFVSDPETTATVGTEYVYEIEIDDPDPYDSIVITAEQLPDWLTLVDNGDATATLTGIPDSMGVYQVVLGASDGMENDNQEFEIMADPVSNNEITKNDLIIYPNPVNDRLFIETYGNTEVTIFSISGERLIHYQINNPKTSIDLSKLPVGIYFLQMQVGDEVVTKKVVKM